MYMYMDITRETKEKEETDDSDEGADEEEDEEMNEWGQILYVYPQVEKKLFCKHITIHRRPAGFIFMIATHSVLTWGKLPSCRPHVRSCSSNVADKLKYNRWV